MSAKDLVGEPSTNDALTAAHAQAAVTENAPWLREALAAAPVQGVFRRMARAERQAATSQNWFRLLSALAIAGGLLTSLSSGLALYGAGGTEAAQLFPDLSDEEVATLLESRGPLVAFAEGNRLAIHVVQVAGVIFTTFCTTLLASQNYLATWSDARRAAEEKRRQVFVTLFDRLPEAAAREAGEGNALSQFFALFCRFQLEVQYRFYESKMKRNRRSARNVAIALAILAALGAIVGTLVSIGDSAVVLAAFLGIAVPVLVSAVQSWRATNLFGDKADAYATAFEALDVIKDRVDAIFAAAAANDDQAVRTFMDEVHAVMADENADWVAGASV